MELFAFTLKKLGSFMDTEFGFWHDEDRYESYYREILDKWDELGVLLMHYEIEKDSKGKPHMHGIVKVPEKFYRKNLVTHGSHLCMRLLYDDVGWLAYIRKDLESTDSPPTPRLEHIEVPRYKLFSPHILNQPSEYEPKIEDRGQE